MSTWRPAGDECPIPPRPAAEIDRCSPCPYVRGASLSDAGWRINCNWPRNGSEVWTPPAPLDDLPAHEIARRVKESA